MRFSKRIVLIISLVLLVFLLQGCTLFSFLFPESEENENVDHSVWNLSYSPQYLIEGRSVVFSLTVTNLGAGLSQSSLTVRWDFGGDGVWDIPYSQNKKASDSVNYTFSGSGAKKIIVEAVIYGKTVRNQFQQTIHIASPENLRVSGEEGQYALVWNDRSTGEEGFRLYRNETLQATLSPNTQTCSIPDSDLSATVTYLLKAYKGSDVSLPISVIVTPDKEMTMVSEDIGLTVPADYFGKNIAFEVAPFPAVATVDRRFSSRSEAVTSAFTLSVEGLDGELLDSPVGIELRSDLAQNEHRNPTDGTFLCVYTEDTGWFPLITLENEAGHPITFLKDTRAAVYGFFTMEVPDESASRHDGHSSILPDFYLGDYQFKYENSKGYFIVDDYPKTLDTFPRPKLDFLNITVPFIDSFQEDGSALCNGFARTFIDFYHHRIKTNKTWEDNYLFSDLSGYLEDKMGYTYRVDRDFRRVFSGVGGLASTEDLNNDYYLPIPRKMFEKIKTEWQGWWLQGFSPIWDNLILPAKIAGGIGLVVKLFSVQISEINLAITWLKAFKTPKMLELTMFGPETITLDTIINDFESIFTDFACHGVALYDYQIVKDSLLGGYQYKLYTYDSNVNYGDELHVESSAIDIRGRKIGLLADIEYYFNNIRLITVDRTPTLGLDIENVNNESHKPVFIEEALGLTYNTNNKVVEFQFTNITKPQENENDPCDVFLNGLGIGKTDTNCVHTYTPSQSEIEAEASLAFKLGYSGRYSPERKVKLTDFDCEYTVLHLDGYSISSINCTSDQFSEWFLFSTNSSFSAFQGVDSQSGNEATFDTERRYIRIIARGYENGQPYYAYKDIDLSEDNSPFDFAAVLVRTENNTDFLRLSFEVELKAEWAAKLSRLYVTGPYIGTLEIELNDPVQISADAVGYAGWFSLPVGTSPSIGEAFTIVAQFTDGQDSKTVTIDSEPVYEFPSILQPAVGTVLNNTSPIFVQFANIPNSLKIDYSVGLWKRSQGQWTDTLYYRFLDKDADSDTIPAGLLGQDPGIAQLCITTFFPGAASTSYGFYEVNGPTVGKACFAKNVLDGQPVDETDTFSTRDDYVYFYFKLNDFCNAHTMRYDWYTPTGALYVSDQTTFDAAESDDYWSHWWAWYRVPLKGNASAAIPGTWHVDFFIDNTFQSRHYFTLTNTGSDFSEHREEPRGFTERGSPARGSAAQGASASPECGK